MSLAACVPGAARHLRSGALLAAVPGCLVLRLALAALGGLVSLVSHKLGVGGHRGVDHGGSVSVGHNVACPVLVVLLLTGVPCLVVHLLAVPLGHVMLVS